MERSSSVECGGTFADRVQQIINRPLTVDIIDGYAETALDDIVQVVEDAVHAYESQPVIRQLSSAESENAALCTMAWKASANY